uniref:Cytochrome c biogenesis B n=1 Tax=Welwitschia mirabilis TaxID=3377 RepID=A0A125QY76_WELMI|nr:cytochrome c biogenesis B [Welwitschia mirabilis]AMA20991.1 cytochrome c biogenesis B [Welwitschia mirabilis]QXE44327.1 cytochrome c biogenesis B [Welwitschia mirabilis]
MILVIGLFHKQILPYKHSTLISFFPFLSYIVVTPLIMGFEKDLSCHFHLGLIRIPLLFPSLPEPIFRSDKEDGTPELYSSSAYCLPEILLLRLYGVLVLRISCVVCSFPMLQLSYQHDRPFMNWLNIILGSSILTQLCGIMNCLSLGITSSSGWNSSHVITTSPYFSPPLVFCTSIETEWFHVLSSIGYSSPFAFLFPILVSIGLQEKMAD